MMISQHPRVDALPDPPEQRRRPLDVGKQERERLHRHSVKASHRAAADNRRP